MSIDTLTEEEIRYWLVNEDWYVSRHMQEWLARTPRDEAIAMLARIASDADLEPRSARLSFLTFMAISGFSMTGGIAGDGPDIRKAGIRAALMLASLGDPRALGALARVIEPDPRHQNKYQELIEAALTRLLPLCVGRTEAGEQVPAIREMVERVWIFGGEKRDLSGPLAELAIAALEFLHRSGDRAEGAVAAAMRSDSTKPNRRRVIDIARQRFGSESC